MPTVIADPQPPLEEMWPYYFDMLAVSGCLNDNWDNHGAIAISEKVIERSKQFMMMALKENLPLEEIGPNPTGVLNFEFARWRDDDFDDEDAYVEISETNYSGFTRRSKGHSVYKTDFNVIELSEVIEKLKELFA